MLAGVLLHVIEAAIAIDSPGNFGLGQRTSQQVRDSIPFVNYFQHLETGQFSSIERLPAGALWAYHLADIIRKRVC